MDQIPLPPSPPQAPREPQKSFIEKLQELDETMKKRVLIAGSAVLMALVVYVWLGYFNSIVTSDQLQLADEGASLSQGTQAAAEQPAAPSATPSQTPGFWEQLGGGMVSLYHDAASGAKHIENALGSPKQYTVTPH